MFSTNLKRSVATVGVVAGLLAAAGPASAQMVDGPVMAKAAVLTDYDRNSFSPQAPTSDGLIAVTVDAGTGDDNVWNNGDGTDAAKGTQVGSEGVKAPTRAEPRSAWHQSVVEGQLNTLGGDDSLSVVADAGSGDDRGQSFFERSNAPFTVDMVADAGSGDDKLLIGKDSTHFHDGTSNTVQFAETGRSDAKTPSLIAKGTQVGSKGMKAPTNAEGYIVNDWDYGEYSQGAKAPSTSGRPQGVIWDLLEEAIEQAADLNR